MANQFAYAPGAILEFKGSAKKISDVLLRDYDTNWSAQTIQNWSVASQNAKDIYPLMQVGMPPGAGYRQSGVTDDGIQPNGYWQETRVFSLLPLGDVQDAGKRQIDAWKERKQDEDFTHTDAKEYGNSVRDRTALAAAVQLAILQSMTAAPGPPVTALAIRVLARDGTVTTMNEDELAGLGISSADRMEGFSDDAIQAHLDIDNAADADAVKLIVDTVTFEPEL